MELHMKTRKNQLSGVHVRQSFFAILSTIMLFVFIGVSCTNDQPTNYGEDLHFDSETQSMNGIADKKYNDTNKDILKAVKKATARFHSTTQAVRGGYEEDIHCVEADGLGGMGYHWVNGALVDPVFDPENPEALLFEKDKNGNNKLIGVEYIVIDIGQEHPHFGDQPFDVGGTPIEADHYSLHMWLWKDNPEGMFTPFNPKVVC